MFFYTFLSYRQFLVIDTLKDNTLSRDKRDSILLYESQKIGYYVDHISTMLKSIRIDFALVIILFIFFNNVGLVDDLYNFCTMDIVTVAFFSFL